jgi:HEAT repeat protein
MKELDPIHHIFRHVGGASIDGDFIDPAAFRRKKKEDGELEEGLSTNWVEYFQKANPEEAIPPLCDILAKKKRKVGATSKFALLNVGQAKTAAKKYASVSIILDALDDDPSHSVVTDYPEALNDQVAEELQKVIIVTYPPRRKA